jgi:hypothetical protein
MPEKHLLSKSSFIKGLQCDKQLYLYKYHYDWMDEVSEGQQLIFDRGHEVGELARQLFPGGILAADDPKQSALAVKRTAELIAGGNEVIYEAAFIFDEVLVIADILVRDGAKWKIFEVKSSTKISDTYLSDAAIQFYVISNCIKVSDISIVYINNEYVRKGPINVRKLFTIKSVMKESLDQQVHIMKELKRLKKVLSQDEIPNIKIGPHCTDPYECSFMGLCWKDVPEYSVFNIGGLRGDKKFDLYKQGHIKLEDVPEDYPLSAAQKMQIDSHKGNKTIINYEEIEKFMATIKYPIWFMDFETFMPAVPKFDGTRPYQQIPFQYSVHYQKSRKSRVEHYEFLADAAGDPRLPFIENLIEHTKGEGVILVYNQAFEITRLKELAWDFHLYEQDLNKIKNRIADLMEPFRKKYYYTPDMQGSYSIKSVLPALVPALSYKEMEIGDGSSASSAFENMYYETDPAKIKAVRENLLRYCGLDTLAMVEVFKFLSNLTQPDTVNLIGD